MKKVLLPFLLAGLSLVFLLSSCKKEPMGHEHTLTLHEAVSPTCGGEGNTSFYECTSCHAYFSDGEAASEITDKQSVILPALAHPMRYEYDEKKHRAIVTCEHTEISYEKEYHTDIGGSLCVCGHQIGTEGLVYVPAPDGTGYLLAGIGTARDRDIVVSDIYMGRPVVGITPFAFEDDQRIRSVLLPKTLTEINGFRGCTALLSVTARSESVTIEQLAFKGCERLTELNLPAKITEIGANAFTDTGYMNTESNWEGGALYIGSCLIKADTEATGRLTVRDGTRLIANDAFRDCNNITRVVLPDSVESIGSFAFFECASLASIRVGDGIRSIGTYAFWGSGYQNNTANWKDNALYLDKYLLAVRPTVQSFTVKDGTVCMVDSIFSQCEKLTSVTLPDSLVAIGELAFYDCSALKSITLGKGITEIGSAAFHSCSKLTSLTLPEGITRIGNSAFSGCSSLTSLVIPDGVRNIEECTFLRCESLRSLTLPSEFYTIETQAFEGCKALKAVELSDALVSIGDAAFRDCTSLTSVSVPAHTVFIGAYAFRNCTSLRSILLPDGLHTIDAGAFEDCIGLTRVTLPAALTLVSADMFSNCKALEEITIGAVITQLDVDSFHGCSSLSTIIFDNTCMRWGALSKGYEWNKGMPAYTVFCIDGTVTSH